MSYWDDPAHHSGGELDRHNWMAHPVVRGALNEQITGDAAVWPTQWFARVFAAELPLGRVLSVGCGTGTLERDLRAQNIARSVVGVDVALEPLVGAARMHIPGISYAAANALPILERGGGAFDAVFFHGSLHHFDDPRAALLATTHALKPGGLLFVDEYVGRRMAAWRPWHLIAANVAYWRLPARFRRPRLIRAPLNPHDPTEATASDGILPAIAESFDVLYRRDYGGLLWLLYANLRKPDEGAGPGREEFDRVLRRLAWQEQEGVRAGGGLFSFVVARRPESDGVLLEKRDHR